VEHLPAEKLEWTPAPAEHFTGQVWFGPLSRRHLDALGVLFAPGARTDWHRHPEGQVLYVVSGAGRVGTEQTVIEVGPGDVVYAPPGELHWHGAAPTSYMMHLSLTTGGPTAWEPRKVTDDEYWG
jgi:quercetin dioxygenase-like cupin family protein